jgi:hypothetical protein
MISDVFVSTAIYALTKQLGVRDALVEWQKQVSSSDPGKETLPVVRTIAHLRRFCDNVGVLPDLGGTIIAQMRSRCFARAHELGIPWISVDDDIEASPKACSAMLDALDDVQPRIVLAPYLQRINVSNEMRISVSIPKFRDVRSRGLAYLVALPVGHGGGFGFVGMNKHAMDRMALAHAGDQSLVWNDEDDGGKKLALFHDLLEGGMWFGEDTSFFRRVPREISVEVLLNGEINHAGSVLHLEKLR